MTYNYNHARSFLYTRTAPYVGNEHNGECQALRLLQLLFGGAVLHMEGAATRNRKHRVLYPCMQGSRDNFLEYRRYVMQAKVGK